MDLLNSDYPEGKWMIEFKISQILVFKDLSMVNNTCSEI